MNNFRERNLSPLGKIWITLSLLLIVQGACIASAKADEQLPGPLGYGRAKIDQPMETDRPDFTEGTQTVTPGHFQLESGYTYTRDDEAGVEIDDHTFPELLWRIGVVEDLELRVGWNGWSLTKIRQQGSSVNEDGATDISLGIKHRMYKQDGLVPNFGFIAELGLPTGASNKTADDVEPKLGLLWAYDVAENTAVSGNLNFAGPIDNGTRYFEPSASLSLAQGLTDEVGGYIEYFGFYPNNDTAASSTHFLNGGFTYLVTENFQLDMRVGAGLNKEAEDFFAGSGLSLRR